MKYPAKATSSATITAIRAKVSLFDARGVAGGRTGVGICDGAGVSSVGVFEALSVLRVTEGTGAGAGVSIVAASELLIRCELVERGGCGVAALIRPAVLLR